jgi:hypothetical protein
VSLSVSTYSNQPTNQPTYPSRPPAQISPSNPTEFGWLVFPLPRIESIDPSYPPNYHGTGFEKRLETPTGFQRKKKKTPTNCLYRPAIFLPTNFTLHLSYIFLSPNPSLLGYPEPNMNISSEVRCLDPPQKKNVILLLFFIFIKIIIKFDINYYFILC